MTGINEIMPFKLTLSITRVIIYIFLYTVMGLSIQHSNVLTKLMAWHTINMRFTKWWRDSPYYMTNEKKKLKYIITATDDARAI